MTKIERSDVRVGLIVENIGGDLRVRGHSSDDLRIEGEEPEVFQDDGDSPIHVLCIGDCDIKMPETVTLTIKTIGGDAKVTNLERGISIESVAGDLIVRNIADDVSIGSIGGDLIAKHVEGNLAVAAVGSDMAAFKINGDLAVDVVGNDLKIRGLDCACNCVDVGSDLHVEIDFQPEHTYQLSAGGDIVCVVTADTDATFSVPVGIEVAVIGDKLAVTIEEDEEFQTITLGDGSAQVTILSADSLSLETDSERRLEFKIDLDAEIGNIGKTISDSLSGLDNLSELGEMIDAQTQEAIAAAAEIGKQFTGKKKKKIKKHAERAQRHAERAKRQAERAQRQVERQAERAQRHAERMRRFHRRSEPEADVWEPVTNEERMTILQMVQDGKISVEEAETLLRALENN